MALIKKYNAGGKTDSLNDFKQYVNKKIVDGTVTGKSVKWINEAVDSFDPNNVGTAQIRKNFVGQIDARDRDSASALVNQFYQDYQSSAPKQIAITPKGGWKRERSIDNLLGFITRQDFGDNEDYALRSIAGMTSVGADGNPDNRQVKKYLIGKTRALVNDYLTHQAQDTDQDGAIDTWKDVDKVQQIKSIVDTIDDENFSDEDWNKLVDFTNAMDWRLNDFLRSDQQLSEAKRLADAKKAEQEKASIFDIYKNAGITDEDMMSGLHKLGYTKLADNLNPYMNRYFAEKGYQAFSDKDGKNYVVFQNGKAVDADTGLFTDDQFGEGYGRGWSIKEGGLTFLDKLDPEALPEGFQLPTWEDPGHRWMGLSTDDANFADYDIRGSSGDNYQGDWFKDSLGRRAYTKQLDFKNRHTGETFKVDLNEDDGKYYRSDTGQLFNMPKITGYSGWKSNVLENDGITYLQNPNSILNKVKAKRSHTNNLWRTSKNAIDINTLEADSNKLIQRIENNLNTGVISTKDEKDLKKIAENLRYFMEDSSIDADTKTRVKKITANIQNLTGKKITDNTTYRNYIKFKSGGILKAESGSSLNQQFAAMTKTPRVTKTNKTPEEIKIVNDENQLKNAGVLDYISLAGSAASFLPGIGVVGGAVSTIADAVKGAQDGWDRKDTMNLLSNLAFTGLAGIGLGATKGLKLGAQAVKAGKAAKTAAKGSDVVELAGKAAIKAKKFGSAGDDVVKMATEIQKTGKATAEQLDLLKDVMKTKTTWLGAHTEGLQEGAKKAGQFIINKAPGAVKYGLAIPAGISGVSGGLDIAKNIAQADGNIFEKVVSGFQDTDIDSIRRATQLGGLARIGYMNKKYSSAAKKYITTKGGKEGFTTVQIGDKSVQIPNEQLKNYSKSGKDKLKIFGKHQDSKKKFLESLKGKVSNKDKSVIEEILKDNKDIGSIKFDYTKPSGGSLELASKADSMDYKDQQLYKIAKDMFERGYTQYGTLSRLNPRIYKNNPVTIKGLLPQTSAHTWQNGRVVNKPIITPYKKQKGGILKLRSGGISYNSQYNNIGTYKYQARNPNTLPYTPISEVRNWQYNGKYLPSYENFVASMDDKFYNDNIGEITNFVKSQKGTYIPKNAQDLRTLASDNKYGPIHNWVLNKSGLGNIKLQSPSFAVVQPNARISNILGGNFNTIISRPNGQSINLDKGTSTSQGNTPVVAETDPDKGPFLRGFSYDPYTFKKKTDWSLPLEGLRLADALRTNANMASAQNRAAHEIPRLNTMSHVYLKTSMPHTALAQKQAGEIRGMGARLGMTTADTNLSIASRLQADRNARETELQGQYKDMERNDAITAQQANINHEVNKYNTGVMDRQSALGAEARQKTHLIKSNQLMANHASRSNFTSYLSNWLQTKDQRLALEKYRDFVANNPNLAKSAEYINYLNSDEVVQQFKDEYDLKYKDVPHSQKPAWEQSDQYKRWQQIKSEFQTVHNQPLMDRLRQLSMAIQGYKSGGSLTFGERAALEDIKYNHKRLLKSQELFYKQILNNTQLIQKALIKVFK